jgi:hypothetical protein
MVIYFSPNSKNEERSSEEFRKSRKPVLTGAKKSEQLFLPAVTSADRTHPGAAVAA